MSGRQLAAAMAVCVALGHVTGCATLEELRQAQMAMRNLESQKAEMERELYDTRNATESCRMRADSLENQLAVKDRLVVNLETENNRLEETFRTAQDTVERLADRPVGPVKLGGQLPEELDTAFQQFAEQNPDSIVYDSTHGMLKWRADLVFAFASDVVKEPAQNTLRHFAEIMSSAVAQNFDVIVVGHTDNVPIRRPETISKHESNRHLSVHRAIAVGQVLQRYNVKPERIGVMGFGEYRPIAGNESDQDRGRNRRVEVYVVPRNAFSTGSQLAQMSTQPAPIDTISLLDGDLNARSSRTGWVGSTNRAARVRRRLSRLLPYGGCHQEVSEQVLLVI